MPYTFKDHEADVALVATDRKLEGAFEQGALALFDTQVDMSTVQAQRPIEIRVRAPDVSALFIEWLNMLIAQRDIAQMLFSKFECKRIYRWGDNWVASGVAWGETADQDKHKLRTEVKAATYCGLSYEIIDGMHTLQCVLDV
jgi:SHS2 domain-containing protein